MADHQQEAAFQQVCSMIHQVSGIPLERIALADSLIVSLGLDSVELIDLFMQLETLGVFIETAHITPALTVQDIVAQVRHAMTEREHS